MAKDRPSASELGRRSLQAERDRALSGLANTATSGTESASIRRQIWSWPTVGAFVLFLQGGGIAFMTSSYTLLADAFFITGSILLLTKFLTWEDTRNQAATRLRLSITGAIVILVVTCGAVAGNHYLNGGSRLSIFPLTTLRATTRQ